MKRSLFSLALVLFSGSVLLASAQLSPVQSTASTRLVVSEYGTLLDVPNAADRRSVGALTADGFEVSYRFRGQTKIVWARGTTNGSGLRRGQVNVHGNSTTVTVTTDDNALEISTRFTLNERTRMLIISRGVKNLSSQTLSMVIKQYLDPKLIGTTCLTSPRLLIQEASRQLRANGRECNNCIQLSERPPVDPPCLTVICMENSSYRNRPLVTTQVIGCRRLSLRWRRSILAPPNQTTLSGNEVRGMQFEVGVNLESDN